MAVRGAKARCPFNILIKYWEKLVKHETTHNVFSLFMSCSQPILWPDYIPAAAITDAGRQKNCDFVVFLCFARSPDTIPKSIKENQASA